MLVAGGGQLPRPGQAITAVSVDCLVETGDLQPAGLAPAAQPGGGAGGAVVQELQLQTVSHPASQLDLPS